MDHSSGTKNPPETNRDIRLMDSHRVRTVPFILLQYSPLHTTTDYYIWKIVSLEQHTLLAELDRASIGRRQARVASLKPMNGRQQRLCQFCHAEAYAEDL